MKQWSDNLINILNDQKPGSCPMCENGKINYQNKLIKAPRGYIYMWCDECGAKACIDCSFDERVIEKLSLKEEMVLIK